MEGNKVVHTLTLILNTQQLLATLTLTCASRINTENKPKYKVIH